jgi:hypothetical protein
MNARQYTSTQDNDCIEIASSADAAYWCKRFSVSGFALFNLLKNVGNSASAIEEFLHDHKNATGEFQPVENAAH